MVTSSKENIIQEKSYAFALRIVKLYKYLVYEKKEYALSKQLLRCGTSIGANIEEALGGQSKRDFYAKIHIAYKEARESRYWIRLLRDSEILNARESGSLIEDIDEILKLLSSITKTLKRQLTGK